MLEGVRHAIGADSPRLHLHQGMIAATEQPRDPVVLRLLRRQLPDRAARRTALGKNVVEHMLATAARTGIPLQADNANVSALSRP